jgi:predicted metalloprotease with PDZ domain
MSLVVSIALAAFQAPPAPAPTRAEPVRYALELLEPETPFVGIGVEVTGDADGTSEFALAEGWAGIAEAGADLELVEARGAHDVLESERLATYRWSVRHAPGEALSLTFELRPTRHRASSGPPEYYLPILEPGLLHVLGAQALPAPEHLDGGEERAITLAWRGFQEAGWRTISSFGAEDELTTTRPLDVFRHALFLAGDLRLHERRLASGALWLALSGAWSFPDEELVALAERIVLLEREFFGGRGRPYYLISLIPVGTGGGSSWGGTGLTDSFALFMTPENGLGLDEGGGGVPWLLAHEHFHEWNGHVIRLAQPEQLGYWFSEGFTDFYTRRLLARGGLLSPAQELAAWNRRLAAYCANPERYAPAERVREAFWSVREVGELPYQRGDLIALLADHAIRSRSQGERSLDDVMRALVAHAEAGAGPFTSAELLAAIGELAGPESQAQLRAWALDGIEPPFPPDLGAPELRLVPHDVPSFDTGFDHEASLASGTVSGVRAGGPAERAGLRDGMRLAGWSVTQGEVDRPIEIRVREGTSLRTLSYLPHGAPRPGWRFGRR